MTLALIAALVITVGLLAFAMRLLDRSLDLNRRLLDRVAELRSAVEYRDEIIESRLGEEAIDIATDCDCPRCREAAYSVN
jgi:hypothetical protein